MIDIDALSKRAVAACKARKWKKDWSAGGCYLHLEVSEFIESLRGKSGCPEEEAADVLICALALIGEYKLSGTYIEYHIADKLLQIEKGTLGEVIE